ncbi:MAG: TolC family protein, partial [bacterium]|nr:TolC family protein [bacterium]
MKKSIIIIGLLLSVALVGSTSATDKSTEPQTPALQSALPFTPDDLYEVALRHNPDHLKAVQNTSLSGVTMRSALGTFLPSLNAGFQLSQSSYYNATYTNPDGTVSTYPRTETSYQTIVDTTTTPWTLQLVPSGTYTIPVAEGKNRNSSAYVSLQEMLNLGGQQYFGVKNAGIQNRISKLQVFSSEMNLYYMVRQGYYNVLARKRLLELAHQVMDQKQEQLKLAKARFDVGSVTELDVLQAEIDVGNQQNAIIAAENSLKLEK